MSAFSTKQIIQHKIVGDPISNTGSVGNIKFYRREKFPHSLDNFLIKIGKEQYAKGPELQKHGGVDLNA